MLKIPASIVVAILLGASALWAGAASAADSRAPPPPPAEPAQNTARYVDWARRYGKAITDPPREDVTLRIGDWQFFEQSSAPGRFHDRVALDASGKMVEYSEKSDWHAFLATPGLDAEGALVRVAWLMRGAGYVSANEAGRTFGKDRKAGRASLTRAADGTITFRGWLLFPPEMSNPRLKTIVTAPSGTKMSLE